MIVVDIIIHADRDDSSDDDGAMHRHQKKHEGIFTYVYCLDCIHFVHAFKHDLFVCIYFID